MTGERDKLDLYSEPKKKIKEAVDRKNKGCKRKRESSEPPPIEWPINDSGYEIYDVVGKGGNAIVNLAKCIKNNKICAIKRVNLQTRGGLNTIINEVRTMSTLLHPYLASFHTSFIYDTELWIVLDYYHFGSLEDIMQRNIRSTVEIFSERMIASLMNDVLRGLIYLHHYGFIHTDIKPGNILLREDGSAVLADFGSARNVNDKRPGIVTTPAFRAPELVSAAFLTCRADIWSIGMTAVNLSGEPVYSMMKGPAELLELYRKFARHSELFSWVTSSCLLLDPKERLTAWLQVEHKFFRKPMKKQAIVRIVSRVPQRVNTWKRQMPPYINNYIARRFGRGKPPSRSDNQEGKDYSSPEWLIDTPPGETPSTTASYPTISIDDEELQ